MEWRTTSPNSASLLWKWLYSVCRAASNAIDADLVALFAEGFAGSSQQAFAGAVRRVKLRRHADPFENRLGSLSVHQNARKVRMCRGSERVQGVSGGGCPFCFAGRRPEQNAPSAELGEAR